ncbi:hypothetical protein ACW6QP_08385 [Salegentibacter sp. HM20]
MQRISKPSNFYRKHHHYIFGGFWLVSGLVIILFENRNFLGFGYGGFGLAYFIFGYFNRNKTDEYIAWDENKIIIKQLHNEILEYPKGKIDALGVSKTDLTIKSGAAAGIMVELKQYSEEDKRKLQLDLKDKFPDIII